MNIDVRNNAYATCKLTCTKIFQRLVVRKDSSISNKELCLEIKEDLDSSMTMPALMIEYRLQQTCRCMLGSTNPITWTVNQTICALARLQKIIIQTTIYLPRHQHFKSFWESVSPISLRKHSMENCLDNWRSSTLFKLTRSEYSASPSCNKRNCTFDQNALKT